jgi:hypothetical protein
MKRGVPIIDVRLTAVQNPTELIDSKWQENATQEHAVVLPER